MKQILAVAILDFRRLGFGLFSAALIAGLLPALATGLGSLLTASPMAVAVFAVVGLSTGGYFGNDFSQGRASFFFARPLPAWSLIIGRFLAMVTLALVTFLAMMATNWLSTSDRNEWSLWILQSAHGEILLVTWAGSLFMSLAVAAHSREPLGQSLRNLVRIPFRLTLVLGAILLTFGLFADLTVRAQFSPEVIRLFFGSMVVGTLVASFVAIVLGRTERLRISRFLHRVMLAQLALTTLVVVAAWTYILHPGPESIDSVDRVSGSPDGELAIIRTRLHRVQSTSVLTFSLDPKTGRAERLDIDPFQGPWVSADGRTSAWSEATPYFFRPLWRMLGGASSFRVKDASGQVEELPLPAEVTRGFKPGSLSFFNPVENILPENQGDVFAVLWGQRLTLGSRSKKTHQDVDLGPGNPRVLAWHFIESGELRVAVARNGPRGRLIDFIDIDPASATPRTVLTMDGGLLDSVRFDRTAARAVVRISGANATLASLFLVNLEDAGAAAGSLALMTNATFPQAVMLADGRITVIAGGRNGRTLTAFSAAGARLTETPVTEGAVSWPAEMFPGLLAVHVNKTYLPGASELVLIDCASGRIVRRIPGFHSHLGNPSVLGSSPPPGSPAARLLLSSEGRLYLLDSPTAEPRPITLTSRGN